jgi:hypothetical protein
MAAAVEALMDNVEERRRLSLRGLQVAADYTLQRSQDSMEAVLTEIAAGPSCGSALATSRPRGTMARVR